MTLPRRSPPLTVTVATTDDRVEIALAGELDFATQGQLVAALPPRAAGTATPLTLDLSELTFCDSAGLAAIIRIYKTGDGLLLRDPSPPIVRLFRMTGLDSVFTIVRS